MLNMNDSDELTLDEFRDRMANENVCAYMSAIGLELHDVEIFFHTVAGGKLKIDIDQFVEGCISMKGPATSLDVLKQLHETRDVKHQLCYIDTQIAALMETLTQNIDARM